jgi:hypothetical protein
VYELVCVCNSVFEYVFVCICVHVCACLWVHGMGASELMPERAKEFQCTCERERGGEGGRVVINKRERERVVFS